MATLVLLPVTAPEPVVLAFLPSPVLSPDVRSVSLVRKFGTRDNNNFSPYQFDVKPPARTGQIQRPESSGEAVDSEIVAHHTRGSGRSSIRGGGGSWHRPPLLLRTGERGARPTPGLRWPWASAAVGRPAVGKRPDLVPPDSFHAAGMRFSALSPRYGMKRIAPTACQPVRSGDPAVRDRETNPAGNRSRSSRPSLRDVLCDLERGSRRDPRRSAFSAHYRPFPG